MATLLEKLQQGNKPATGTSLVDRLRQAEAQGVIQRGQVQEVPREERKASPILPGLAKAAATAGAAISGGLKTAQYAKDGFTPQELSDIQNSLTKERNVLGLGRSRPAGIDEQGREESFGQQVKDIVGSGLETASFLAPAQIGRGIITGTAKTLPSIIGGTISGSLGSAGSAMAGGQSTQDVVKEGLIGALAGGALGGVLPNVGALYRSAPQTAQKVANAVSRGTTNAPKIATTGARAVQRLVQSVPERISALGTNIADVATNAAETATKPAAVRSAISMNIPDRIIDIVQTADDDTIAAIKAMRNAANNKIAPKKTLAKVVTDRVRFAQRAARQVGRKMEKAVDNMMLKRSSVPNPRTDMLQVLADNNIQINAKGKIINTGGFTTDQAQLLKRLVDELPKKEFLTPKQVVLAKQKLTRTIREAAQLQGISPSEISVVASRLEDVLTSMLSDEYRALSKEYAILKSSIDEFLQFIGATKKNGAYYTIDDVLTKDTRIGSRLMRLLNADPSRAEETLKLIDDAVKRFGYRKTEDLVSLAEVSNALEQIYDMVPSRSFKAGVSEGVAEGIVKSGSMPGMLIEAAQKAIGGSRANQKKAFDNLLHAVSAAPQKTK